MDALGFDPGFLGTPCPLPEPAAARRIRELAYTHFTVLLDTDRRLAAATAVNIDGPTLLDLGRGDDWHLDERAPADEQTGPEVYARNDLDRGHLVRRRDPVWGDAATAATANIDTFTYTNAAPQAAQFNQSKELWNGLEDYVLAYAETYRQRLSVFTGPVLGEADPEYRGARIPLRFWKIACWATPPLPGADPTSRLAASAYLLDQSPQLGDIDLSTALARARETEAVPPLGPYRTFQLPVTDVATLTALDLGALEAADVYAPVPAASGAPPAHPTWREITSPAQLRF
ncbi:DNA/RNA non-specific endonuclease [Herbiconiux sp. CPCC 205763]|uniref:DNA/RNA non-specific endonuclease n=1 Tax=Herbiconiux aconitum TaxID=2970913 RepID=A0ABT2GPF7_9MICO|nr:DNA/RNA non-specific endonuclease [Herbiconiux aconitum]MCS5718068.1 DNA/RNA non-specific endonuclease [Herbiconiux aconitum]